MRHLRVLRAFVAAARLVFQPFGHQRRRKGTDKGKGKATGGQAAKLRAAKHQARIERLKAPPPSTRPARDETFKRRPHEPPNRTSLQCHSESP